MKHCVKKLLSLAFALALCLAVGGIALAETPEQEVLAYEQNVTTAADVPNTTGNLERDGYTVTIPTTVEVKSGTNTGELMVTAQLKQYRLLNIGIASKNSWKLAYDDATAADTPQVGYTLTTEDYENRTAIAYYEDNTLHYGTGELDSTDPKYDSTTGARKFTTNFSVNVKDPSQATMSGTYSDTLTFTFDLVKHCVTYTINVYEQKLQLTNSGAHVQAVNVVDASGNVTDTTSAPKETYVLEYGCAGVWGDLLGTAVESDTWKRTRPANDGGEDERCWEDLSRTLTPKADFQANNKTQTINLNLVRKWYWLDVNGATDYAGGDEDIHHGNQGARISGYVNMRVSVDGTHWSSWFWQEPGDDYWGQFPYGIQFKLGFHHVKNGYVYDTGTGTLENGFRIIANKQDTVTAPGDKVGDTTYYVYTGELTGEPTGKDSYNNVRYCYIPCYKKGLTYMANQGTGGKEDVNGANKPRTNVLYDETGTLETPDALGITAPADMVFAGWSTSANYPTTGKLYQPGDNVSTVNWENYTDQTDLNKRPQLNGKKDVEKRELYAIWKKPYTVKVQFGGDIGWTDWDDATQSFSKQGGDGFDTAVELGTAYAYGNTSLTLSATENKTVWNALQAMIAKKTSVIASGHAQQDDVWQLKDEYTFTTLPANGEVTIQIKRERYLLDVIPALLQSDGSTITPAGDKTEAEKYGKFDLDSCGKPQTLEGKISYYQWMRNYGGSYSIHNVVPNTGYQFAYFRVIRNNAPVNYEQSSYGSTLTGKDEKLSYFGDTSGNTYTGDTIYVVYKKDMVTFDFNGGITGDSETKRVLPYDDTVHFPKVVLTKQGVNFIGWSTKKDPKPGDEIFKLATDDPDHGVNPDVTTVSSKVKNWPDENNKVLYAVWSSTTGPNRAPAKKKVLTVHYHANFDPMEELALDLDPNPLLEDMDEDFGFDPDPLPEDILDPTVEAVKIVTYKPDENVVLRNCMFKRGGYVFVGWNTEPDGTGRLYRVNGVPVTDWADGDTVDLYAQWKKPEHLKPVVDGEPQPGGATPAPTPQPGGADAAPAPQPGGADDAFGIDPQQGGMDDAFGIDPHLGGMDDAFGIDPHLGGMEDAFGVDPQPGGMDDAFGVDPQPGGMDDAFGV